MAAYTELPDGTLLRWHAANLTECRQPACPEAHATKAQLNDWSEALAAHEAERGIAAGKGER